MREKNTNKGEKLNKQDKGKRGMDLDFVRVEALKLIPDDFGEKDLDGILELIKKLGALSSEEREELFKRFEDMTPEEIVVRLERVHKIKDDE